MVSKAIQESNAGLRQEMHQQQKAIQESNAGLRQEMHQQQAATEERMHQLQAKTEETQTEILQLLRAQSNPSSQTEPVQRATSSSSNGVLVVQHKPPIQFVLPDDFDKLNTMGKIYRYIQAVYRYRFECQDNNETPDFRLIQATGRSKDNKDTHVPMLLNKSDNDDLELTKQLHEWGQTRIEEGDRMMFKIWATNLMIHYTKTSRNKLGVVGTLQGFKSRCTMPPKEPTMLKKLVKYLDHFLRLVKCYESFYSFVKDATPEGVWTAATRSFSGKTGVDTGAAHVNVQWPVIEAGKNMQAGKFEIKQEDFRCVSPLALTLRDFGRHAKTNQDSEPMGLVVLVLQEIIYKSRDTGQQNPEIDTLEKIVDGVKALKERLKGHLELEDSQLFETMFVNLAHLKDPRLNASVNHVQTEDTGRLGTPEISPQASETSYEN